MGFFSTGALLLYCSLTRHLRSSTTKGPNHERVAENDMTEGDDIVIDNAPFLVANHKVLPAIGTRRPLRIATIKAIGYIVYGRFIAPVVLSPCPSERREAARRDVLEDRTNATKSANEDLTASWTLGNGPFVNIIFSLDVGCFPVTGFILDLRHYSRPARYWGLSRRAASAMVNGKNSERGVSSSIVDQKDKNGPQVKPHHSHVTFRPFRRSKIGIKLLIKKISLFDAIYGRVSTFADDLAEGNGLYCGHPRDRCLGKTANYHYPGFIDA
ncbi:uncharacterized protein EV420DRAFT_1752661 [Desarmillaria tabescens]|uniref:Uncharacterized protein n=1 Tax=Armillaria tabescens TaxID=1929756 RepID=A0AA39JGG1_ARMTA|nr:uncharacterized protein EV420DRAFT_1752661 [Desarmillaria tabescens]KAK0440889.1 hypothetical protein EV420DRAFT_1752661 [Desarmillaria tabescens]